MTERERAASAAAADLAAAMERAAVDLALTEEPARFLAALETEPVDSPSASPDDRD